VEAHTASKSAAKGQFEVQIHNEENGENETITAGRGEPVRVIIEKMYRAFGLERQEGDRLRCKGSGEDVFAHADEHLGDYQAKHCPKLSWLFVGDTGGA
jgi:hypothetical protein